MPEQPPMIIGALVSRGIKISPEQIARNEEKDTHVHDIGRGMRGTFEKVWIFKFAISSRRRCERVDIYKCPYFFPPGYFIWFLPLDDDNEKSSKIEAQYADNDDKSF